MSLDEHKLPQENRTIQNLADTPTPGSLTAQQLKAAFDEFPERLRQKHNDLIDTLAESYPDAEELRLLQGQANTYLEHAQVLASPCRLGHVRLDGKTITLNRQGQVVATGATQEIASYQEALAGEDNSKLMTPYLVRQALANGAWTPPPIVRNLWAQPLGVSAYAWHGTANLLAAVVEEAAGWQLALYACTGSSVSLLAQQEVDGPAREVAWAVNGTDFYVHYQDNTYEHYRLDNFTWQRTEWPGGMALAVAWDSRGRFLRVPPALPNEVEIQEMNEQGILEVTACSFNVGEICGLAFAPWQDYCALVDKSRGAYHLRLGIITDDGIQLAAVVDLPERPVALAWHPAGEVVAVAYDAGPRAVELYSCVAGESWRLLAEVPGMGACGLAWQAMGRYLAVSGLTEAAYRLYLYDGQGLRQLYDSPWQASLGQPLFHHNGLWLAIAAQTTGGSRELHIESIEDGQDQRYLPVDTDFTASPYGRYLLAERGAVYKITCFAQPEAGQYFCFGGDFPAQVEILGGAYPVIAGTVPDKVQARGRGLYQVMFSPEAGGCWQVLPLSQELADSITAEQACDDSLALTPYGGGRLLGARGRRAATVVVAAADSHNPQAADFCCSGQHDQLVIRQAVAALPSTGGRLVFLDGTYLLDTEDALVTNNNGLRLVEINRPRVAICGLGKNTCFVLAETSLVAGQVISLFYVGGSGFSLTDCSFDTNTFVANGSQSTALELGVYAEQAAVRNCEMANFSGPAIINAAPYCQIQGNWLHHNGCGVHLRGGSCNLTGNDIYDNNDCGILSERSQDIILHNRLNYNGLVGIELHYAVNSLLQSNLLLGNGSGLVLRNSNNLVIKDNFVRRSTAGLAYGAAEDSLLLDSCSDILVEGNWLRGKDARTSGEYARIWASYGGTDWNPSV